MFAENNWRERERMRERGREEERGKGNEGRFEYSLEGFLFVVVVDWR